VSAAFDDDALIDALMRTTTPAPGLNRRSAPLARAQLIAWAVAVVERSAPQPLHGALAAELAAGAHPVAGTGSGGLPPPPPPARAAQELSARIRACLDRLPGSATAGAATTATSSRAHR
jgi:hypothetical protein